MIFKNTIEVAEHVKISINLDFDILKPYIQYATDAYITPYLGYNLVDKLEKILFIHAICSRNVRQFSALKNF